MDSHAAFYHAEHLRLLGFVERRVGDKGGAEDICQEVWMVYFNEFGRYQAYDHPVAPLFAIANYKIAKWCRARNKVPALPGDEILEEYARGHAEVFGFEERIDLKRALARLTSRQREALVLRHVDDLPREAVADLMGITEDGVKKLLHNAKQRLREIPELAGYQRPANGGEVRK